MISQNDCLFIQRDLKINSFYWPETWRGTQRRMWKRISRRTFFGCCSTVHKLHFEMLNSSSSLNRSWMKWHHLVESLVQLRDQLSLMAMSIAPRQRLRKEQTQLILLSVLAQSKRQFPWNLTLNKRPSCLNYATAVRMLSMRTCFVMPRSRSADFGEKLVASDLITSDFLRSLPSPAARHDVNSPKFIALLSSR